MTTSDGNTPIFKDITQIVKMNEKRKNDSLRRKMVHSEFIK